MCGIAGGAWFDPAAAIDDDTLRRMTRRLAHRGPDDEGYFRAEFAPRDESEGPAGVALGHRRLSIIDLAGGHQPLSNEDGSVWITFNGEIYNFRELRQRLEGAGHRFHTASDTETIVHLYEDEGLDFLARLEGMFALALWDGPRRRLILARDRLGKKPLVYAFDGRRALFASELKALLAAPGVGREIDRAALDAYLLYQYVPPPRTIFAGVWKLPPGHWAVIDGAGLKTGCYWRPDLSREVDRPEDEIADELRETLARAVRARLQSDVPLGAFLSGGVDSSLVVALMSRETTARPRTFAIGFSDPAYDETRWARLAAEACGAEHHEFRVDFREQELLPKLAWHFDEPFGDSSALPTYCVARLAREHVKVALTGDGGDELFAGYTRYQAVRWAERAERLPGPVRALIAAGPLARCADRGPQRSWLRRLGRFAAALADERSRRYEAWVGVFSLARRAALYTDAFAERLGDHDPAAYLDEAFRRAGSRDAVTAASLADLTTYLPSDLLCKVDIASMAHGLECRQPFLDHRLVELAASLPLRMKLRGGDTKWILKRAFADLLPRAIARRAKQGFGVPLARWFRGELASQARATLLDERAIGRGYFRREAIERLLDEHTSGRWDHGHRLWALMMLELWHRQWVDG